LFQSLLADVPRTFRAFDTEKTVQMLLHRIQSDLERTRSLPQKSGDETSNEQLLLIDLPEGTIVYKKEPDQIVRYALTDEISDPNSPQFRGRVFSLPQARINWKVWREKERGYAVEVCTALAPKFSGPPRRILENSHVYFIPAQSSIGVKE
jgi:hypothetical protein